MTLKEFFDTATKRIMDQGERAWDAVRVSCVYCTPGGLRCVIGQMIPEGHPGETCEENVSGLLEDYPDLWGVWFPGGVDRQTANSLMRSLQCVHDASETTQWAEEFRGVAHDFRLEVPEHLHPEQGERREQG